MYCPSLETAWPIPRTQCTNYHLHPDGALSTTPSKEAGKKSYIALGTLDDRQFLQFTTAPFDQEIKITGHIVARLNVSLTPETDYDSAAEKDIDIFLTLRYIAPDGKGVHYTGTVGDQFPCERLAASLVAQN